jgi:hypothetical protein
MKEITIYEFQLKTIIEALRITSQIYNSKAHLTSFDRQVTQAYEFAKNALANEKDKVVKYPV